MALYNINSLLSSQWIISLLLIIGNVSSFTISVGSSARSRGSLTRTGALIIGWDDDSDSYKSTFDSPILDVGGDDDMLVTYTSIADRLSHNRDKQDSLARLAVAFSPPEQTLKLEDINQIQIIEVDNEHIEISAVVCDETECVTLLVPVSFPHECGGSSIDESAEECVLDNIIELDVEAQSVLNKRAIECQESTEEEKELLAELHNVNDIHLPSWWIAPERSEMSEECQNIKRILNQEDFQQQLQGLVKEGLEFCEDGDLYDIRRAVVCAVGPAGFYFRAIASPYDASSDESSCMILDIPYSIFLNNADDNVIITEPSSLRSAVLGAMASISE